jgi:hypothetical protein
MRKYLGWEPIVGYFCFMIGALLFNLGCVMGYFSGSVTKAETTWITWFSQVLGSILFTVGGGIECYHNEIWHFKCMNLAHWVSLINFIGGALFLFAATCGMIGMSEELGIWLIDLPYTIGSGMFLIGSFFLMILWK